MVTKRSVGTGDEKCGSSRWRGRCDIRHILFPHVPPLCRRVPSRIAELAVPRVINTLQIVVRVLARVQRIQASIVVVSPFLPSETHATVEGRLGIWFTYPGCHVIPRREP